MSLVMVSLSGCNEGCVHFDVIFGGLLTQWGITRRRRTPRGSRRGWRGRCRLDEEVEALEIVLSFNVENWKIWIKETSKKVIGNGVQNPNLVTLSRLRFPIAVSGSDPGPVLRECHNFNLFFQKSKITMRQAGLSSTCTPSQTTVPPRPIPLHSSQHQPSPPI